MLAPWLARKKWQGKIGLPLRLTKPYRLGLLNWSAMPAFFPLIQKVLELTRYVLEIDEFRILLLSPRDCPPPKTEPRTSPPPLRFWIFSIFLAPVAFPPRIP
jgi:hypothetical protein